MIFLIILLIVIVLVVLTVLAGGTDLHFHRKPEDGKIRVACVGDSITYGCLVFPCFRSSYPARLQKMLSEKYHVENFGLNDRALQCTGNKPYTVEREYRNSLKFQPDIVVIMLGTNDTKDINWISKEQFADQYGQLIHSYRELECRPVIYLCTPPWAVDADNFICRLTNDCAAGRLPDVAEAVTETGKNYGLQVIEMYSVFKDRRKLLGHDGLHPNRKGAKVIAGTVYAKLIKSENEN